MGRSGVHGVRDPEREIVSSRFHYVLKKVKTLPVVTHKDIGYGVLHVPIKLTSIFREFLDHVVPNLDRQDSLATTFSSTPIDQHFFYRLDSGIRKRNIKVLYCLSLLHSFYLQTKTNLKWQKKNTQKKHSIVKDVGMPSNVSNNPVLWLKKGWCQCF